MFLTLFFHPLFTCFQNKKQVLWQPEKSSTTCFDFVSVTLVIIVFMPKLTLYEPLEVGLRVFDIIPVAIKLPFFQIPQIFQVYLEDFLVLT